MSTWKRGHACLTACVVAVLCGTLVAADAIDMQARTKELQNLRWGMFICWSFSTFSDKEWTGGVKDIAFFQATEVDPDQWVRTAKEAEMGYILFLTKHHDGFCLWDTKTTDRKVTNAPLGRDVLAEVKAACDKYGLKLALYYSEGDWTWPGAVDGKIRYEGVGLNPEEKKAQLRELLTQYGPIEYIWFDYAVGDGGVSHADTIAFCKALQPGCFIGFNNGDQEGSDIRLGERGRPGRLEDHSAAGPHMDSGPSTAYRLAEFTYPILPPPAGHARWFYTSPENDGLVHSPEKIYRDYLGAVKYGNIFALNVGPDRQGRLRDIDVATLRTVGEMIRTKTPNPDIRAYGIDLNMEPGGSTCFAPPGLWAEADPAAHVAWYETLGANVILTPAVSSNGYAWYKGGAIPAQPGLKHDFLPEVVRVGHEKHMRVIGSFRIAANTRWGGEHPDLSYGTPHDRHLPLTTGYLDYLAAAIEEALTKTKMDGIMIDWVMNPSDKARDGKWLPVDKDLFSQLTGRPFPGEDNLSAEARLEYERRAIERCWRRIYITAKRVNPDCIILLSCQGVQDPVIAGTRMLREVDWIMDESGSAEAMRAIAPTLGSHTRQLLCVGGRGSQHDAAKILADTDIAEFGICGFSSPGPETIPGPVEQYLREPVESFKGDERNFACVVRFFNDLPLIPSPAP